eukprot:TRINITY_DN4147_c0_g1_i4.p1 TRINITY_DN4147_c0_g1~~TRINITY_DN4147_c0_g1_i4.p1  ORF type:complete len:311 (+),score=39.34 TRINITY_DN4147_c0_g1_i4:379-1311(+)
MSIVHESDENKQVSTLQNLVKELPLENQNLLHYLFVLCRKIDLNSDKNKMNLKNLASLLAPNLLYQQSEDPSSLWNVDDTNKANAVMTLLMQHSLQILAHVKYDLNPLESTSEIIPPVPEAEDSFTGSSLRASKSEVFSTSTLPVKMVPPPPSYIPPPPIISPSTKKAMRNSRLRTLKLANEEEFDTISANVLSKNNLSGWLLLGYSQETELCLQNQGVDVNEFILKLQKNEVQYGLLRIPLNSEQSKDFFVCWNGPEAPVTIKEKIKTHISEVKSILQPWQIQIIASSTQNFTIPFLSELKPSIEPHLL